MKHFILISVLLISSCIFSNAQNKVLWEELTSIEFEQVAKESGVCIIPMGVLEKHGPHMALGTDALVARQVAVEAAKKESAIVFPFYYFGQIFEAMHQPGTISYSPELLYKVLDETCKEISRNGIKKIILYNFHGGSNNFLKYFCQAQLASPKDYVVYFVQHNTDKEVWKKVEKLLVNGEGGHADETEAAMLMCFRPDLVHLEHANDESGEELGRLPYKDSLFTGIWWYADFPNHYSGNAKGAKKEVGDLLINDRIQELVQLIKRVKDDSKAVELQNEFFQRSIH